ncbi:MAG: T9SS type B sorting domain-containing protein [Croceitalea sp.]|nr:T9SS type B sorting domain-containing protein [Croceitalea sp.]
MVAILTDVAGWDGTYEGSPLPTGDYWYVVNTNNNEKNQFVGHFTLYR